MHTPPPTPTQVLQSTVSPALLSVVWFSLHSQQRGTCLFCALLALVHSVCTAHSPPQADPGLSPLWRLGEPVFPVPSVDVERALSHGPGGRALSPEVGPLEEGVCPPELLMTCESSKAWQELVFRIWAFSPQGLFLWCFRVCTAYLLGAL